MVFYFRFENHIPLRCGLRGGYVELVNIDPDVIVQFRKALSAKLCSAVTGQVMV